MMVSNSLDLWQKDAFFPAAEEVQDSADRMESAYRTWLRGRKGVTRELLDELSRELQTALGTAKWQLEEFEKAVRLSHGSRCNDNSIGRHRDFIAVIESQISCVEASLKDFFNDETKQPMRWVNLDDEERDDLALFISGGSEPGFHDKKGFKDLATINNDAKYVIEIKAKEVLATRDNINCQIDKASGSKRTWSSSNLDDWKIVIADCDEKMKKPMLGINVTSKERESKLVTGKQKCEEIIKSKGGSPSYIHLKGNSWINQRQPRSPRKMQFRCSVRVALALMLSIFLLCLLCSIQDENKS